MVIVLLCLAYFTEHNTLMTLVFIYLKILCNFILLMGKVEFDIMFSENFVFCFLWANIAVELDSSACSTCVDLFNLFSLYVLYFLPFCLFIKDVWSVLNGYSLLAFQPIIESASYLSASYSSIFSTLYLSLLIHGALYLQYMTYYLFWITVKDTVFPLNRLCTYWEQDPCHFDLFFVMPSFLS